MGAPVIRLTDIRCLFLSRQWRFRAGVRHYFQNNLRSQPFKALDAGIECPEIAVVECVGSTLSRKRLTCSVNVRSQLKFSTYRIGLRPMRASSTVWRVVPYRYHTDGRIKYGRYRPHLLPPSYFSRTIDKNVYGLLIFEEKEEENDDYDQNNSSHALIFSR